MGIGASAPVRASEGLASEASVRTTRRVRVRVRVGSGDDDDDDDDGDGDGYGCVTASETGVGMSGHALDKGHVQRGKQVWMRVRDASPRAYYFAGDDLGLAGEGVFSPAVSMPPSPVTPRMPLHALTEGDRRLGVGQVREGEGEGIMLRRRVQGVQEGHT